MDEYLLENPELKVVNEFMKIFNETLMEITHTIGKRQPGEWLKQLCPNNKMKFDQFGGDRLVESSVAKIFSSVPGNTSVQIIIYPSESNGWVFRLKLPPWRHCKSITLIIVCGIKANGNVCLWLCACAVANVSVKLKNWNFGWSQTNIVFLSQKRNFWVALKFNLCNCTTELNVFYLIGMVFRHQTDLCRIENGFKFLFRWRALIYTTIHLSSTCLWHTMTLQWQAATRKTTQEM